MAEIVEAPVLVQVVDVREGREISWGSTLADRLGERLTDVQEAIAAGVSAVSNGLSELRTADQWKVNQVSATFGITLTAEAGVLLSRAGAEATFEVTVTFQRNT